MTNQTIYASSAVKYAKHRAKLQQHLDDWATGLSKDIKGAMAALEQYLDMVRFVAKHAPDMAVESIRLALPVLFTMSDKSYKLSSSSARLLKLVHDIKAVPDLSVSMDDKYALATLIMVRIHNMTDNAHQTAKELCNICSQIEGQAVRLDYMLVGREELLAYAGSMLFGQAWMGLYGSDMEDAATIVKLCWNDRPPLHFGKTTPISMPAANQEDQADSMSLPTFELPNANSLGV